MFHGHERNQIRFWPGLYSRCIWKTGALEERVKDPFFGIINFEDPIRGISYHESINLDDPYVHNYLEEVKKRPINRSCEEYNHSEIAVEIKGLEDVPRQTYLEFDNFNIGSSFAIGIVPYTACLHDGLPISDNGLYFVPKTTTQYSFLIKINLKSTH